MPHIKATSITGINALQLTNVLALGLVRFMPLIQNQVILTCPTCPHALMLKNRSVTSGFIEIKLLLA